FRRDVDRADGGLRVPVVEDTDKASLPAADIEDALACQVTEKIEDQLDVVDARIDGGWEMLFVGGVAVEGGADLVVHLAELAGRGRELERGGIVDNLGAGLARAGPIKLLGGFAASPNA